ncbi:MAG TPA: diaminopimelate decarboxylase [Candidatus Acidoferrales bacterium]|nr:diaminopimelate decarboxylase [Candidatus Acidoferrales bacterium]
MTHALHPASAPDPTSYTPFFRYRPSGSRHCGNQRLFCEGVALDALAQSVGTPTYVYSRASIEAAYRNLDRALGNLPHSLCYAVKANSNLAILRLLARLGSGFDIVSGGELERLGRIGVSGERIVFSGVGKTGDEIRAALSYNPSRSGAARRRGILLFNIESEAEMEALLGEAARHVARGGARPGVAIRVNPDVLAGGHPHISTGHRHHKFGVDWREARKLYLAHKSSRWIAWRGISAHIGSQILTVPPFRRAVERLASYVRELAAQGIALDLLDIGGGLGIRYTEKQSLDVTAYARTLAEIVRPLGCRLLVEPGRTIAGPSGVLLTRVLYTKQSRGKTFVIVDAGMNDLIRPALYGATHPITTAVRGDGTRGANRVVDVVGPVCETGDFLARDWPLGAASAGDLLVIWAAGAYGFAQSSNYNSRPRAAEVLVASKRFRTIRRRENFDDLVRLETA